jgi:hypothetical protein
MRKAIALLACLLYGCTGPLANLNYQPVILNTEDDVQSLKQRLYASSNAKDFAYEVMQITNYRCDQFFESLDRLRSDSDFALSRVSALSTGLPQLLQAAHVSGTAMANVASALGFVTGTINDTKQYYLLADFKPEIYKKWQIFRTAQQGRVESSITERTSIPEAKLRLYEYVRLCLPSQLKQWLHESANSVRSSSTLPMAAGPGSRKPGPFVID